MKEDTLEFGKLSIFKGIDEKAASSFVEAIGGSIEWFSKGDVIRRSHKSDKYIGILMRGKVQAMFKDRLGREIYGYDMAVGSLFGNIWATMNPSVGEFAGNVRENTAVLFLPHEKLLRRGKTMEPTREAVVRNLFTALSERMYVMFEKLEVLSQRTLKDRLKLYILQQEKIQGTRQVKVPGRVQFAKLLECNRSALTREVGRMEDAGEILCGDDWMEIVDRDGIDCVAEN